MKKSSGKKEEKKDDKNIFILSIVIYILNSFINIDVVGSKLVICSRWPAIQRYSWISGEVLFLSSGLTAGVDGTDWVVVGDDCDFFLRVIRLNKCFKHRYRAKQQHFSK